MIALTDKYMEDVEFFDKSIIMTGKFACMTLSTMLESSNLHVNNIAVFTDMPPCEQTSLWNRFFKKVRKNISDFSVEFIPEKKLSKTTPKVIEDIKKVMEPYIKNGIIILGGEKLLNACRGAIASLKYNIPCRNLTQITVRNFSEGNNDRFPHEYTYIYIPSAPDFEMLSPCVKISERAKKHCINTPYHEIIPYALLLDPDFTISTQTKEIVSSSLQNLTAAVWYFLYVGEKEDYQQRWASHVINIITHWLPEFIKSPFDYDIKERLLTAAALAGMLIYSAKDNVIPLVLKSILSDKDMKQGINLNSVFCEIWKQDIADTKNEITERTLLLGEFFHASDKDAYGVIKKYKRFIRSMSVKFSIPFTMSVRQRNILEIYEKLKLYK